MSLRIFVLTVATIVPTLALAAPAQLAGACKTDLQTLCAGVQPGGGRIRDCMKEHRVQLSTACKISLADRMLEHSGQRGARGEGRMERGGQSVLGGGQAAIKPVPQGN
jgi:Cysteine rich repeat